MTFTIESRKFCCCLPVRLGVFVLSLLSLVGGGIIAAIGWISVSQLKQNPVEITDEIALFIHSSIFTLLAVLGMFGFVGSLVKSQGMVIAFSVGLAVHLGLSIGSGVFTIYSVFKQSPKAAVDACLDGRTDADSIQVCNTGMSIVKGVIVAIYVIAWLLELYAYFIVSRYADQLQDQEIADLTPVIPRTINQTTVYQGYPQRFSYSAYTESRRSYAEPQWNRDGDEGAKEMREDDRGRRMTRPHSEYAFNLPQQAYGVSRGKDPSNLA